MNRHPLIEEFLASVAAQGLIPRDAPLVAGVSGGGDSMALLVLLHAGRSRFGWQVTAVHVNHGLRPEADADEEFVRCWCQCLSVPLVSVRVSVSPGHGQSLEMAARAERHGALAAEAKTRGALVVLAHQADDQAETVLLRILRGTGVGGLAAMRPRSGPVVRPLLPFRGQALRAMLRDLGIPWREDASNRSLDIPRNRIRHELLPALQEYNPRVSDALVRLARSAALTDDWATSEAERWYRRYAEPVAEGGGIRLRNWSELHPALGRRVLRLAAAHFQIQVTEEQIDRAVLAGSSWPRGHMVTHQDGDLIVRPPECLVQWPPDLLVPPWPGRLLLPVGSLVVEGPLPDAGPLGISGDVEELRVRGWEPGDRIHLRAGHRKLQDLFVDRKVPRARRSEWPIVVDRTGAVAAVPGLAVDTRWSVPPGQPGFKVHWDRHTS